MLFHQLDDETGFIIGADTVAGEGSNLRFFICLSPGAIHILKIMGANVNEQPGKAVSFAVHKLSHVIPCRTVAFLYKIRFT